MRSQWFSDCPNQVHLDFHMPEFPAGALARLDAQAMADTMAKAHVDLVALFAKDHFGNSFYDTQAGHKHAKLTQDFLGQTARAMRHRSIRTLGYYSVAWDKHAWDHNPDWRVLDAQGNAIESQASWQPVCVNSPYREELMMPQLAEIARYPVDGVFLDTPIGGGFRHLCHCKFCQRKWKLEFGLDITKGVTTAWRDQLVLRSIEQYLQELRGLLDRINPELIIVMNTASQPHVNRRIKQLCDVGVWESQPRGGDYLEHSFAARTTRNDLLPAQVQTVRFYEGWGDLSLKPEAQLMTECAAMLANGAPASVGDQVNVDGTLEPAVYEMMGRTFERVRQWHRALRGAQSVHQTAILLPVPDAQGSWLAGLQPDLPQLGGITPWRGAHKMLVESHVQADLLYSVLAEEKLDTYRTVILPEPSGYQPGMFDQLRKYVEKGGTLVAVGRSTLHDGQFELEDVLGIRYQGLASYQTVHFRPGAATAHATAKIPLQLRGPAYKVITTTAQELAAMHWPVIEHQPPQRAFRSPYPPACEQPSGFSFATVNTFGKGRAVYIAGSIFQIYWKTNHHWLRQFTQALLEHVDPAAAYSTDAPATVELNLMRRGNDLLLNLVNYALGHQGGHEAISAIERSNPVRQITCRVRCAKPQSVTLEPMGTALDFQFSDGVCAFIVPEVEYLTVVRLAQAAT